MKGQGEGQGHWQPLLLIIPLRLGLTEINPIYFDALKVSHMTDDPKVKVTEINPIYFDALKVSHMIDKDFIVIWIWASAYKYKRISHLSTR